MEIDWDEIILTIANEEIGGSSLAIMKMDGKPESTQGKYVILSLLSRYYCVRGYLSNDNKYLYMEKKEHLGDHIDSIKAGRRLKEFVLNDPDFVDNFREFIKKTVRKWPFGSCQNSLHWR
jgi:hypothetical protein